MTKILYQKPDLQIIEIETEDVITTSPGEGDGKPGTGGTTSPNPNTKGYVNSLDNRNRWSNSEF